MPNKQRLSEVSISGNYTYYDSDGKPESSGVIGARDVMSRVDNIIYENSGYTRSNACHHTSVSTTNHPFTYSLVNRSTGKLRQRGRTYVQLFSPSWWNSRVALNSQGGIDYPIGFLGRAYAGLIPKIDGDVNAVNFLLELAQFKSMFTSILSSAKLLASGKVGSATAESHLNYSFGWRPFISDVMSLSSSYSAFKQKINNINNSFGKIKSHHYREVVNIPSDNTVFSSTDTHRKIRYRNSFEVVYHCTVKYRITPIDPSGVPPTFSNYLKSLGFRPSLATVWNAIPFSFVLDWVFKVGNWLASFDGRIPCDVEIIDSCGSMKAEEYQRFAFLRPTKSGSMWYASQWPRFGETYIKTYHREVIYPSELKHAFSTPRLDNVDLRELKLALSLLIRIGKVNI